MMPQRIQKQDVQAFQFRHRLFRHGAEVRQISGGAETKCVDRHIAVHYLHGRETRSKDIDGTIDRLQFNLRQSTVLIVGVEDVAEDIAQNPRGVFAGVQRNLGAAGNARKTQRPNIIESKDVVGMAVGVNDRVDLADLLADGLLTEVGRGVDENGAPRRVVQPRDRPIAP